MDFAARRRLRRSSPVATGGGEAVDPGLATIAAVAMHFGIRVDRISLAHELALGGRRATTADLIRAAIKVGMKARHVVDQKKKRIDSIPRPSILIMNDGQYAILGRTIEREQSAKHEVHYFGESSVIVKKQTTDELFECWAGELILVARDADHAQKLDSKDVGFRWFLSAAWRYRRPFAQVLIASLFVQLFALVTPLFFQVVIDKVLVHNSASTLLVVVVGLILMGVFDVTLQYLRSYALAHTASRLDVEFGRRLFDHLLKLPLMYFETRPAGQTIARLREIENVRNFLTGNGLTSLIDIVFTLVFFLVLFLYSPKLTFVVLLSIPVYVVIAFIVRPILRDKIREQFTRNASSQQFLVESVVGVYTVKAAAVEPLFQAQWDEKLAAYVKTGFQARMLGNLGQNSIQFVSKLGVALILYFGAHEVMSGAMTVGGLIAFNMISNQLIAPILRLSQLWQEFQQIQVSVERIGDILRLPTESRTNSLSHLPPLRGAVAFRDVSFRYSPDTPVVLQGISLSIPAGQVIGIVGPSGSGKSTLAKIVQRLYLPTRGEVMIDGMDITRVSPVWLRQQIGVVLQENLLFSKTVHENIALATPYMSREEVINVARLAGADEFISKLPNGYDTHIEERGSNLSGGQRQRIAIARALARNPRVLIFDEATSALDYESEHVIHENMREIVRGRTVIIIAHRLAAVRNCDRIVSIDEGKIVEDGTHHELVAREDGLYSRLWALQSGAVRS